MEENYKKVRQRLEETDWRVIPFEGLLLSALTLIEESWEGKMRVDDQVLINFERCRIVAAKLKQILSYQQYSRGMTEFFSFH